MEEKDKGEVKEQKGSKTFTWYLVQALILLAVVGVGVFAVNQALEYRYRAEFLKTPCALCVELNPDVKECITRGFNVYPGLNGDWVDNAGKCWDFSGKEIECKGKENLKINNNLSLTYP